MIDVSTRCTIASANDGPSGGGDVSILSGRKRNCDCKNERDYVGDRGAMSSFGDSSDGVDATANGSGSRFPAAISSYDSLLPPW